MKCVKIVFAFSKSLVYTKPKEQVCGGAPVRTGAQLDSNPVKDRNGRAAVNSE
jgi:hypothetical protein